MIDFVESGTVRNLSKRMTKIKRTVMKEMEKLLEKAGKIMEEIKDLNSADKDSVLQIVQILVSNSTECHDPYRSDQE